MTLFLMRDPTKGEWKEHEIQAYCIQELRRGGYFCEGDQNAAKRSYGAAARAKACGMLAGSPDIRIYCKGGKLYLIELKKLNGIVSETQFEWHRNAYALGFSINIVRADVPQEALDQIRKIITP